MRGTGAPASLQQLCCSGGGPRAAGRKAWWATLSFGGWRSTPRVQELAKELARGQWKKRKKRVEGVVSG